MSYKHPRTLRVWLLALLLALPAFAQQDNEYYELAVAALNSSEPAAALIHLKNALQINPDHIPARIMLGWIYFNDGDIYASEKEYGEALLLGADINLFLPTYGATLILQRKVNELFELEKIAKTLTRENQFEWSLLKGQGYSLRGEPDLARQEFERAAAMFPAEVRANNTLASSYLELGLFAEAQALVDKSMILDPADARTWQVQGEIAMRQAQHESALRSFLKAESLAGEDPRVLRSLAHVYLELKKYAELNLILDRILEQSPDDPTATLIKAMLVSSEGGTELGFAMLAPLSSKLSQLEGTPYETDNYLFIRAVSDYLQGNAERARTLFTSYLERNKTDLLAIRLLTDLLLQSGDRVAATQLLAERRAVIAQDFGLSLQLIQLYIEKKNILGAQEMLEQVKAVAPDHPYVVMLEAEFLRFRNQRLAALALLDGKTYEGGAPLAYDLLRGQLLLETGQVRLAQSQARQLLSKYADSIVVHNFAAESYLRVGQLDEAQTYIEAAQSLDPANMAARFNMAYLLREQGQFDEANLILNAILEERPQHTGAILLVADIMFQRGDYDAAVDWSNRVYAYEDSSTKPAELQLAIYSQTGKWEKALEQAIYLTKQDRLNPEYQVQLATVYIKMGKSKAARRPLNILFSLWENDSVALQRLAELQLRAQFPDGARQSLQRALELDAQSFDVRLALARLEFRTGDIAAARVRIGKLQQQFGDRAALELLQGEIALAEGQPEAARGHFSLAWDLDPDNTAAVGHLYQLAKNGTGGEAFTARLEEIIKARQQPAFMTKLLADSYLTQGQWPQAARHYEALLKVPALANNPAVLNNLANIYAVDDLDKALATAKKGLVEKGQNNPALLDTIGWILAQQERHEEALPYLREAYAKNSTDPEIRYHIGATLLAMGRDKEASVELRAAIAAGQNFAGAQDARRLLDSIQ